MSKSYQTSPTKRRTTAEMGDMLAAIRRILGDADGQITIRHLFYRLVGLSVIPKTEQAYKGLCGHLSKWRRSEEIPWAAFTTFAISVATTTEVWKFPTKQDENYESYVKNFDLPGLWRDLGLFKQ